MSKSAHTTFLIKVIFTFLECKATFVNKKGIEKQRNCVFPFTYEGKTYNKCTKDNSENGKSWCAYKVNRAGVAVDGKWADCDEGCPGSGKFSIPH